MSSWWQLDVIDAQKLPLLLCLLAFVVTFAAARLTTRMIRAGRGPFRDQVTSGGLHLHHAVAGLLILTAGSLTAVGSGSMGWSCAAGLAVGIGLCLVLDEFALILYLRDVYWAPEGRLSVSVVSLTAAVVGLVLVGLSPFGVDDVGGRELATRLGAGAVIVVHGVLVGGCLIKGKYRLAFGAVFVPPIAIAASIRLARPDSVWARRYYSADRTQDAVRRAADVDRRWSRLLERWDDLVGGAPTQPR